MGEFILGSTFLFAYYANSNIEQRKDFLWQKIAGAYLLLLSFVDITHIKYGTIINVVASIAILTFFYKKNLIFKNESHIKKWRGKRGHTNFQTLNRVATYNYDLNENLSSVVDAELNTTTYEYDERNLLFKVKDANVPQGVTQYD